MPTIGDIFFKDMLSLVEGNLSPPDLLFHVGFQPGVIPNPLPACGYFKKQFPVMSHHIANTVLVQLGLSLTGLCSYAKCWPFILLDQPEFNSLLCGTYSKL